jgi:hypothetical protein
MERRFWLLRRLSRLLSVLAWIVLGLVVVVVPVGLARGYLTGSGAELTETLTYGASGVILFVWLLYMAQWIQVLLAIEENTKHQTYVLEKLATLTQQVRDRLSVLETRSPDREEGPAPRGGRE